MDAQPLPLSQRERLIFVNLAVKDLQRATDFFGAIGFDVDPRFTDANATCLLLGKNLYAMLLSEPFFRSFTKLPLADPLAAPEAIVALSAENRAEVDRIVDRAFAAGAAYYREPDVMPGMYSRSFKDPDGHLWEVVWMDIEEHLEGMGRA